LQNQVGLVLTLDGAGLDGLDPSSPMVGVDDGVADRESHVTSTPSAVFKGSTRFLVTAPALRTYAQVSTLIRVLTNAPIDAITPHSGVLTSAATLPQRIRHMRREPSEVVAHKAAQGGLGSSYWKVARGSSTRKNR